MVGGFFMEKKIYIKNIYNSNWILNLAIYKIEMKQLKIKDEKER